MQNKRRVILLTSWYILVAIIILIMLYTDFDWFEHWWTIIPYLVLCSFISPLINKIAPKKTNDNESNN